MAGGPVPTLTLTPSAAKFDLTALDPWVGLRLEPDAAALELDALDATLDLELTLTPDVAMFRVQTPVDAATHVLVGAKPVHLAPDPAVFKLQALTAMAAGTGDAAPLTPSPAALTLSAPDVSVAFGDRTLLPDPATLDLVAPDPALLVSPVLKGAGPAVLRLEALAVDGVDMGTLTLTPTPASFTIGAPDVTRSEARTLTPSPAELDLLAPDVTLLGSLTLTPNPATFTLHAPTGTSVGGTDRYLRPTPAATTLLAPLVTLIQWSPDATPRVELRTRIARALTLVPDPHLEFTP